ncbi:DUF1593 domain-containing protein [bacterium]|nr:DUF1593 domain-containing protein [bacterium]
MTNGNTHTGKRLMAVLIVLLAGLLLSSVVSAVETASPAQGVVAQGSPSNKPRLLVLTDIGQDPDDEQSLVRLMLYANEFDIEGFIATSDIFETASTYSPDDIYEIVGDYATIHYNLQLHDPDYPDPSYLGSIIKRGNPVVGQRGQDLALSIGPDRDTEGSNWIIEVVDRPTRAR